MASTHQQYCCCSIPGIRPRYHTTRKQTLQQGTFKAQVFIKAETVSEPSQIIFSTPGSGPEVGNLLEGPVQEHQTRHPAFGWSGVFWAVSLWLKWEPVVINQPINLLID